MAHRKQEKFINTIDVIIIKVKKCELKPVRKFYLEDLVVNSIMPILNNEKIDEIAKNVCDLSEKESNTDTLKRLKRLVKENEAATENLIKAPEGGKVVFL